MVLYDVTTLVNNPLRDGIRRVSRDWLEGLLNRPLKDSPFSVVPVYSSGGKTRICVEPIKHMLNESLIHDLSHFDGQLIQGDIFLIPAYDIFVPNPNFSFENISQRSLIISIIYDILPITNPEWFPEQGIHDRFIPAVKKQFFYSDRIIVNTYDVKKELEKIGREWGYANISDRVDVVPLAGVEYKKNDSDDIKRHQNYRSAESTIDLLVVGTVEPRKGHKDVLRAFMKIANEIPELTLTFVGRLGWNSEETYKLIKQCEVEFKERFTWLQSADDVRLEYEYINADLVICASEGEGYGLPLVESMSRGVPVLARNIPVFLEVAKNGALFFGNGSEYLSLEEAFSNIRKVITKAKVSLQNFKQITSSESLDIFSKSISKVIQIPDL